MRLAAALLLLISTTGVAANDQYRQCLVGRCLFTTDSSVNNYELSACQAHQCDMACAMETGFQISDAKKRCRRFIASDPTCDLDCTQADTPSSNRETGTILPGSRERDDEDSTLLPEDFDGDEPSSSSDREFVDVPSTWESREDLCSKGRCPREISLVARFDVSGSKNDFQVYIGAMRKAASRVYKVDENNVLIKADVVPLRRRNLLQNDGTTLQLTATVRDPDPEVVLGDSSAIAQQVAELVASDSEVVSFNGGVSPQVEIVKVVDTQTEAEETELLGTGTDDAALSESGSSGVTIALVAAIVVIVVVLLYCVFGGRRKRGAKAVPAEEEATTTTTNDVEIHVGSGK